MASKDRTMTKMVKLYYALGILSILAGGVATAATMITHHFATKEELQQHAALDDAKMDAFSARLSEEVADKVIERMNRWRRP